MRKFIIPASVAMIAVLLWSVSCTTPVGITSWKNPDAKGTVSKIAVLAIFDKLNIVQPVEQQCVTYFSSQNLPSVKALDFLNPFKQYEKDELKQKLDSAGTDGLLLITYKSTDVSVNYNQGFYGGYRGYWGYGGSWYVDKTFNLRAMLYGVQNDVLLWTGDLTVTNPDDVNAASLQVAQAIFGDWVKNQLLKNPPPPPKQ